ncbi:hypothetical protein [Streptomyces sp. NPDC051677]|uniref:hypothetical protein n=1 Tax=Streptomyces sp. NPDC051677 TaxID=3365669 RepID=UPI0037CDCF6F
MTTNPPDPPSPSTGHGDPQPCGPAEPPFSAAELSAIARRMTWQQRAALRVLARTPSRVRQRTNGSPYVDTQTSSHIAITTWHILERKGLAYRDHTAHPTSLLSQRLALTHKGLAVLNYHAQATYPSSATRLWPPTPPRQFTSHPTAQDGSTPSASRR